MTLRLLLFFVSFLAALCRAKPRLALSCRLSACPPAPLSVCQSALVGEQRLKEGAHARMGRSTQTAAHHPQDGTDSANPQADV
ncbi:hypothetical protein O3P69_002541 [Scylla paramamosain]|uniref:Secreted protein n=1 Tax=Scylla paramamosain TaxID=85552 RepID=A0AAW0UPD6_SCYPA